MQEDAAVQSDPWQTSGAVHCHQDCPCTTWPQLGHRQTQRWRPELPRVCYLQRGTGECYKGSVEERCESVLGLVDVFLLKEGEGERVV